MRRLPLARRVYFAGQTPATQSVPQSQWATSHSAVRPGSCTVSKACKRHPPPNHVFAQHLVASRHPLPWIPRGNRPQSPAPLPPPRYIFEFKRTRRYGGATRTRRAMSCYAAEISSIAERAGQPAFMVRTFTWSRGGQLSASSRVLERLLYVLYGLYGTSENDMPFFQTATASLVLVSADQRPIDVAGVSPSATTYTRIPRPHDPSSHQNTRPSPARTLFFLYATDYQTNKQMPSSYSGKRTPPALARRSSSATGEANIPHPAPPPQRTRRLSHRWPLTQHFASRPITPRR